MTDEILRARPFIPRTVYTERIKPFIDKGIPGNDTTHAEQDQITTVRLKIKSTEISA